MENREFYSKFYDEESCIVYLRKVREEKGVKCRKCNKPLKNWSEKQKLWRCKCGNKQSLKVGTVMESSNLSLRIWFEAIYLVGQSKKTDSTCEYQRKLNLKRYETTWFLIQKIRKLMANINSCLELQETFIFCTNEAEKNVKNINTNIPGGFTLSFGKQANDKYDAIRLVVSEDYRKFNKIYKGTIHTKAYRMTKVYPDTIIRKNLVTNSKSSTLWLQRIKENFNRYIKGSFHYIKNIHIQNYLDEFSFKYNHRYRQSEKFEILINALE